jgi:hypothetical protein
LIVNLRGDVLRITCIFLIRGDVDLMSLVDRSAGVWVEFASYFARFLIVVQLARRSPFFRDESRTHVWCGSQGDSGAERILVRQGSQCPNLRA